MPGAKGHLHEHPEEISGHMTINPHLRHRLEREREARHRREAEDQDSLMFLSHPPHVPGYFPNGLRRH